MPVINDREGLTKILAKAEENPWMMYLIVRDSLNMTSGKIAAQVGHAVDLIFDQYYSFKEERSNMHFTVPEQNIPSMSFLDLLSSERKERLLKFLEPMVSSFESWKSHSRRKIVLRADDKEWIKLKQQMDCYLVVDAGLTEIPAYSETVIALWPIKKSQSPPLLKRLRLL